ncbi:MAG: rod shape-determining protein MreC [Bacilli bacterium]|nr:rod shape-determining protein MreC [Bacilli bacterium]
MYKRKRIKTHHLIIIIVVIFLLVLSFVSKMISDNRTLTFPEKIIKDTGLFINKIVYIPINFITTTISDIEKKNDIYEKYQALEEEIEKTDSLKAQNEQLIDEINAMKELLSLNNTLYDYEYVNATVINRNIGYWFNNITIDKGSNEGIEIGMPVIVSSGLVGKVTKVTNFTSTVKLITTEDTNNKISVKINIDGNYIYGILSSYDETNNVFLVDGIAENDNIEIGSLVVTSGLSDYYPSGIVVGKVTNIETDNFDLAKTLEVTPQINYDDLSYVTVLIKEIK